RMKYLDDDPVSDGPPLQSNSLFFFSKKHINKTLRKYPLIRKLKPGQQNHPSFRLNSLLIA
ncbi:MAG: hypothetical protein OEX11_08450, partial [Nitrosomonas sp.]|nr:hypothetical protein [Nitrosomonas sp.]